VCVCVCKRVATDFNFRNT